MRIIALNAISDVLINGPFLYDSFIAQMTELRALNNIVFKNKTNHILSKIRTLLCGEDEKIGYPYRAILKEKVYMQRIFLFFLRY